MYLRYLLWARANNEIRTLLEERVCIFRGEASEVNHSFTLIESSRPSLSLHVIGRPGRRLPIPRKRRTLLDHPPPPLLLRDHNPQQA